MLNVLIADNHPLFRDALQRTVQVARPGARTHDADTVASLLELIEQVPDAKLLLLDLHIPGASGYSALVHIRAQHPSLPIMVVSAHEETQVARRALTHGAAAYISKSASAAQIAQAIAAVLAGDSWMLHPLLAAAPELQPDEAEVANRVALLTPQQFRVLSLLAAGVLNKQIAYDLGVSEATIKAHMTVVMRKLGVNNRTQVALAASHLALAPASLLPNADNDDR